MKSIVKKFLSQNEFIQHVLTLIAGNGVAQVIPLILVPILARIYSPEVFGLFALFMGVTSIASVASTGRYELAINLPKEDTEAFHVFVLSLCINCIFCLFLMCILLIWNEPIASMFGRTEIADLLYIIPLSIFLTSLYQSLSYWGNRKKDYKKLAINRVLQSISVGLAQIGASVLLNAGRYGLISGEILGRLLSSILLIISILKNEKSMFFSCRIKSLIEVAKRYQKFPKYLVLGHGINVFSSQAPLFFLDMFFGSGVVGFFALADRALRGPLSIIGTSISDVFRQKAAEEFVKLGNCHAIYVQTFKKLLFVSLLIFIPLYFTCPFLFEFVFGYKWRESGEYAQVMIPMLAFGFVVSPLSAMFMVAEKQRLDLVFQIFLLLGAVSSFSISIYIPNPRVTIGVFSIFMCSWYIMNIIFSYSFAKGNLNKNEDCHKVLESL